MDADRFDHLARSLTGVRSRRSALGAALASSAVGMLGLGRTAAQATNCEPVSAGGVCVMEFQVIVRQGPGAQRTLVAGSAPGTLRGYLRFRRSTTGQLLDADLLLPDGGSLPVVGQITGYVLQARIDLGQGRALVAGGVGEQPLDRCLGRLDGTVTSTDVGDLGEWHALAGVQNIPDADGGGPQAPRSGAQPTGGADVDRNGSQASGGIQANGNGARTLNPAAPGTPLPGAGTGAPQTSATAGVQLATGAPGESSRTDGNGDGRATPENDRSDRPVADASSERAASEVVEGPDLIEARQESDEDEIVLACPEHETRCGNICVNLQSDATNCGRCGNLCADRQACVDGSCTTSSSTCPDGQTRCGETCVTTATDIFNCGKCGQLCALGEDCSNGQCRAIDGPDEPDVEGAGDATCAAGQTRCNDVCTDLRTDIDNCGECQVTCGTDEACDDGLCVAVPPTPCQPGQVRCDGVCKEALPNFGSQGISCPGGGATPTECPAGQVLCNGACFPDGACQPADCAPGWGYCYGVCRDFQSDPGACGGCGKTCSGGGFCAGGMCTYCSSSLTACGQECVDTRTDLNNCGGCGNLCGTQCINGQCTAAGPTPGCAPGATRCGEICVDLASDFNNCGACGNVCNPGFECRAPGECGPTEAYCQQQGLHSCGLSCRSFDHPESCGGCGLFCQDQGATCKDGLCYFPGAGRGEGVPPKSTPPGAPRSLAPTDQQTLAPTDEVTCAPGLDVCGGVCVDLTTDLFNCGICGVVCGASAACEQGQCVTPGAPADAQTLAPVDTALLVETAPDAGSGSEPASDPLVSICPAGQVDCNGVCTDLTTDPVNCGACSVVCSPGSTCDGGFCSTPPALIVPGGADAPVSGDNAVVPDAPPASTDVEAAPTGDAPPAPADGEPAPVVVPESEPAPIADSITDPVPAVDPGAGSDIAPDSAPASAPPDAGTGTDPGDTGVPPEQ